MKHLIAPPPPQAPITETALCTWLGAASSGDAITYHRGALARDICPQLNLLAPEDRLRLAKVSGRALSLAQAGQAILIQRRHGFEDYEYILVARRRPRRAAAALLLAEAA